MGAYGKKPHKYFGKGRFLGSSILPPEPNLKFNKMADSKIEFLPSSQAACCDPNASTSKVMVEGCAAGVSYMVLICDSDCGATTSLSYMNMSTGVTSNTPPTGFTLGTCSSKTQKVGCIPYLETETFEATAGQTSFVLANTPNGDVRFSRNGSTVADNAATVSGNTVTYVPAENNSEALLATDRIDISYVYAVCDVAVEPFVDCAGKEILNGAALLTCDALDPATFVVDPATGQITISGGGGGGTSQALTDCKGTVLPNGSSVLACDALDPNTFVIDPATGEITLNGGKGSVVAVADLIAGHKIGKITVDGVAYTINETVTSLGTVTYDNVSGLLSIPYTDENGTLNVKTVTVAPTFVNTDGQQITGDNSGTVDLTLTAVVVGGVTNYTVKADLNVAATAQSGAENQLKWSASLNGYYVEPATGAETKVVAGTNVTVTGTGTTADPYIINAVSGAVSGPGQVWSQNAVSGTELVVDDLIFRVNTGSTASHVQVKAKAGLSINIQGQGLYLTNATPVGYVTGQMVATDSAWRDLYLAGNSTNPAYGERNYFLDRTNDRAYEVFYQRTSPAGTPAASIQGVLCVHRLR